MVGMKRGRKLQILYMLNAKEGIMNNSMLKDQKIQVRQANLGHKEKKYLNSPKIVTYIKNYSPSKKKKKKSQAQMASQASSSKY